MKREKLLSGVNKKCAKCTETCKQWEQVIVVFCPNYRKKLDTKTTDKKQLQETGSFCA